MLMNNWWLGDPRELQDGGWWPERPAVIRWFELSVPPPNLQEGEKSWRLSSITREFRAFTARSRVWSLVGKLRSCKPRDAAKKKKSSITNDQWLNRSCPCNETSTKNPKWCGGELPGGRTQWGPERVMAQRGYGAPRPWTSFSPIPGPVHLFHLAIPEL